MRCLRLFLAAAAVCISGSLYSADYRLTINGTPKDLEGAKSLLIYESGMKQGDRVLEIRFSTNSAVRGYEVSASSNGASGIVVAGAGTAKGFGGYVVGVRGKAPAKHLSATLALLSGPLGDRPAGLLAGLTRFVGSSPGIMLLGSLALLIVTGYFIKKRISNRDEIYVPARRRKTIETALAEITERLEEIDTNQKNLVKKPPMLRTFKAQIDGFEERLDRLHATLTKASTTVVGVEAGLTSLRSRIDQTDEAIDKLSAAEENTTAELHGLAAKVELAERTAHESAARSAELLMMHTKQDDEIQGLLFVLQEGQKSTHQAVSAVHKEFDAVQQRLSGLEKRTDDHGRVLGQNKDSLDSVADLLNDLDAKIEKVPATVGEKLSDLSHESRQLAAGFRTVTDKQQSMAEALETALAGHSEALNTLESGGNETSQKLDDLKEGIAKLESAGRLAREAQEASIAAAINEALTAKEDGLSSVSERVDEIANSQRRLASELPKLGDAIAGLQADAAAALGDGFAADREALESIMSEVATAIASHEKEGARRASALEQKIEDLASRLDQRAEAVKAIESQIKDQKSSKVEVIDFTPMLGDMRHHVQSLASDHAKTAQSLADLSMSMAELIREGEDNAAKIEARFGQIVEAITGSSKGASDTSAVEERVAGLAESVSNLRAENERHATALEARVESGAAEFQGRAQDILSRIEAISAQRGEEFERSSRPETAVEIPTVPEVHLELVEPVAGEHQQEDGSAENANGTSVEIDGKAPEDSGDESLADSSGWHCAGSSPARRWSVSFDRAVDMQASDEPLKPLTPTETSAIDYGLGAMLFANGRVYYAHGDHLRGFWPGKGDTSVALAGDLGCEQWRLAFFRGRVFCVHQNCVEIIGLGTAAAQAKYSGTYVDQVCTDSHWAGLLAQDGGLLIDFRDEVGRQIGKPRPLPAKAEDARAMAAHGETIYVGLAKGKVLRVTATEISEGKFDGEPIWLSARRSGLIALVRTKKGLRLTQAGSDGVIQGHLDLDFATTLDNPVIMGDKLYLVNADTAEIVPYNLKTLAVGDSIALPGSRVVSFAGVYKDSRQALLVTVQEGEGHSGSVVLIEPKSGDSMMVCRVNHPHVAVIAANGKIVVATGCSYQNMIRVFDPCAASARGKRAA